MDDSQGGEPFGSQGHYVSCMKINGVPLIPPLMTQEYRNEMQYYKQLALAVERRISDLNTCMDDSTIYSNNLPSDTEECFDGTNMSYDNIQDRSSFSDKIVSQSEQLITDADHSETGKPDQMFESNDFESMNSQVTIIDMSSETVNDQNAVIKNAVKNYVPANKGEDEFCKLPQGGENMMETDESSFLESPSIESLTKKDEQKFKNNMKSPNEQLHKSAQLNRTHSKESVKSVLGNSSLKNTPKKTPCPTNAPRTKKITPLKKENISPAAVYKKSTPKSKLGSPYELPKMRKKIVSEKHKLSPSKNVTGSLNNISSGLTSPPSSKLVRQNSYTLESPSPLLMAHLEVQSITSGIDVGSISMSESTSQNQLCHNSINKHPNPYTELSTSIGSDINSLSLGEIPAQKDNTKKKNEDIDMSSLKSSEKEIPNILIAVNNKPCESSNTSSPNVKNICSELFKETDNKHRQDSGTSPHIPQTESYVETIPNTDLPRDSSFHQDLVQNEFENKIVSNGIEILSDLKSITCKDPKVYFDYIMRKFQEDHESQMMALIQKQQDEQLFLKKTFENQQKLLFDQFQTAFANGSSHTSKKSNPTQLKTSGHSRSGRHPGDEGMYIGKYEKHHQQTFHKDSTKHSNDTSCSDSMEKYLTISADVLNTSRCLLINRKTVNLSPTDIQCVNVMPTQPTIPCILNDTEQSHAERLSGGRKKEGAPLVKKYHRSDSTENGRIEANPSNADSKMTTFLRRTNTNTSFDSNRSYPGYDEAADEPLETGRTNNTMDDLNFTFSSDDGAHTNKLYTDGNRNEYYSTSNYNDEYEKAAKLKNARSKISEIQKNLASQTLTRPTRSLHLESNYLERDDQMSGVDQTVSLSSIDVMSNYYPRNFADRHHLSLNLTEINKPSNKVQPVKRKYKTPQELEKEIRAATTIVSHCKGYLTRRLMKTERVETTVQTIRDTLMCALQLHRDEAGIQGADVDLHRRLIQQITAACYALHDIFILSPPEEQMAIIRQDRERRAHRAAMAGMSPQHRQLSATTQKFIKRKLESMSRSHSGVFTSRSSRSTHYPSHAMTRSHYEQSDHARGGGGDKARRSLTVSGDLNPRKPWR